MCFVINDIHFSIYRALTMHIKFIPIRRLFLCMDDVLSRRRFRQCEHLQNDRSVRDMLGQRGIQPEDLPPAEDIKKLEWRVKS